MYNQFSQYQMPQYNQYPQMRQYGTTRQEVTRVNGEGGANAYQMMPNSSALLLDETAPIVWLVTTDGAGFKTVAPYKITPFVQDNPQKSLEERIKRLEDTLYEKSHVESIEQTTAQHDAAVPAISAAISGEGPASNRYGSIE